MHRSETRQATQCSDCGAEIRPAVDRIFAFGERGALCFDCALRRGGSYDEAHDHWTTQPDTDDLGRLYD